MPYFIKSERNFNVEANNLEYHGVTGEQAVSRNPYFDKPSIMMTEAFQERGLPLHDYNGKYQYGSMQAQSTIENGVRVSTNNAFIQPIRHKRKNLTIKVNSEAVKILVDRNNKAYGIEYIRRGKKLTAYADKEVILSSGVIDSPKLLMLSGIGPKIHLEKLNIKLIKDLAVGENLHDHITFNGIIVALPNRTSTLVAKKEILDDIKDYYEMDFKRGPLSGNGPVNTIAFLKTDPELEAPDIQYQVAHVLWREYIKEPTDYEKLAIYPTAFYDGMLPRTMNLVPKSRGKLLLNESNPNGPPLIYANYFDDPRDFESILRGVKFLLSLENTYAFKSMGAYFVKKPLPACKDYESGSDGYIICLCRAYTSSTYHPVGTCKMGPRWDEKAVVDPELRVYGISRLRVIDSSIMPVVPRGNTNAPSIMIGERGVAFVIAEWLK